ncbi:MAG: nucleotidyl transferase AbiEii/AbiGii toxin family protein [Sedimentisphaerales bacterium]|nr:nucleotidyl transferase AbiEii/AbiGii toxin family protein [Sedimentisphaerales bacterium]
MEQLIRSVAEALDNSNIPYMIIGGQAVLLHGRARFTEDIDLTLGIDTDQYEKIEKVCEKLGLRILPENPRNFAEQTGVLPAEHKSHLRIDFIFSFIAYEKQAIERAVTVKIDDYPAKFTSCEDLIIQKMVSGRAIDEEDVKTVLLKNHSTIDTEYIYKWLNEFAKNPEYKDLPQRLENLLKDLQ